MRENGTRYRQRPWATRSAARTWFTAGEAALSTSPDRRYFGHLGHVSPRPGPVRKVSMIGPGSIGGGAAVPRGAGAR